MAKAKKEDKAEVLEGQPCPICNKKTLALTEAEKEVPYFGKVFIFSMACSSCKYHKADLECAERQDPSKYTIEVSGEEDMKIRVVKSSEATVKIPFITTIEPGPASNGYITNIEGIFSRIKHEVEEVRDNADEKEDRKKAKNILKKIQKVMWGEDKVKVIIEDPSGNSAIISEKAVKGKLKV